MNKSDRKPSKGKAKALSLKTDEKEPPELYDRAAAVRFISKRMKRPADDVATVLRSRDRLYVALGLLSPEAVEPSGVDGSRPYVLAPREVYKKLEWQFVGIDTRMDRIFIGAVLMLDRAFVAKKKNAAEEAWVRRNRSIADTGEPHTRPMHGAA
jgi:hypothetical protein